MTILEALAASPLSLWVLQSPWGYYALLSVHGIGMAGVVGSTFMLCWRVLGFARGVIVTDLGRLRGVAWAGFAANAISGAILFCSDAPRLAQTGTFQIKMILIALGGAALWTLWGLIGRSPGKDAPNASFALGTRIAAMATFAFWSGAIIFGRDIAYALEPVFDLGAL